MYKGQLKRWNNNKGFGFIQSDELSQDTFIHISTLKTMSRKPKVGDFIYFEVAQQGDGKTKAVNCRIEGVASKPVNQGRAHYRVAKKSHLLKNKFIVVLAVLAIGAFTYQRFIKVAPTSKQPALNITQPVINNAVSTKVQSQFSCDGRQYCSQMTSRAEAVFFIQHCPNTKMDGDNDGRPCENDSRF